MQNMKSLSLTVYNVKRRLTTGRADRQVDKQADGTKRHTGWRLILSNMIMIHIILRIRTVCVYGNSADT